MNLVGKYAVAKGEPYHTVLRIGQENREVPMVGDKFKIISHRYGTLYGLEGLVGPWSLPLEGNGFWSVYTPKERDML